MREEQEEEEEEVREEQEEEEEERGTRALCAGVCLFSTAMDFCVLAG